MATSRDTPCTVTGASIMFCSTVMWGNRLNDWNTMPILRQMRRRSASRAYMLGPPATAVASGSPSTCMLPSSMVSRWIRQRRKVLLPEPDGPMTATTSPLRRVSDTSSSTLTCPNDLPMPRASIMTGRSAAAAPAAAAPAAALLVVLGIAFFHVLEQPGQQQRHNQIKGRRHQERRRREIALHNAARGAQDIVQRQHVDERRVFDQGDGFVAERRQHALHHLRQGHAPQRLQIGHAQLLAAF